MSDSRSDPRHAWYVVGVLMAVYMIGFIDRQILSILAGRVKADLLVSDAQLGFLYGTVFGIFYAVFGVPLGVYADRGSRRNLIAWGLALWSAMTIAYKDKPDEVIPQILPTIDGLGVPQVLKEIVTAKRGLCIMVGATGSGKSTTLAAMVDWRNENSFGHIITVEDPIEFVHPHKNCVVTQREVGLDTDTWEAALKNTLRQAPDVILMGEIRDRETMEHAVAFAETGHLCLATLHANSANQALDRIVNFFPEERRAQLLMDLSLNLKAMVSQRLLPKQDGKGRAAAVEVMLNTPLIADLIFKGDVPEIKEIMKKSRNLGMQTFDQSLFDLFEANVIGYEDALRNADSVNDLRLQIKLSSQRAKTNDLSSGTEHFAIV